MAPVIDLRAELFRHAGTEGRAFSARRGELIEAPGAAHSPLYLIAEGAAQVYYVSSDGARQTLRLGYPGEMLAALPGFFLGVSSPLGVEALRRCAGYALSRAAVSGFCESSPARAAAYARHLELITCGLMARELDLLEADPAERYRTVLARSPQLFEHVPLRYIASYLRMTPETLSRVRRKS